MNFLGLRLYENQLNRLMIKQNIFSISSRLEQRRETVKKTDVDIETQMAEAELRRRNMEAERIKKLSELSGLNKIEKVVVSVNKYLFSI